MAEKKFEVKLDRIEVANFSIKPMPMGLDTPPSEFNFTITMANKVLPEHKLIVQQIDVSIDLKERKGEIVSDISILIGYYINNFEECIVFDSEKKIFTIDKDLDLMMRNISIGTARGVYVTKLQGTYLHMAHMPIVLTSSFQNVPENVNNG